jgi:hypothetical protein
MTAFALPPPPNVVFGTGWLLVVQVLTVTVTVNVTVNVTCV